MTRSYRHTPIAGNTIADSEKGDKRVANRRLRRRTVVALQREKEVLPLLREVSDVYNFAKDGKRWRAGWK